MTSAGLPASCVAIAVGACSSLSSVCETKLFLMRVVSAVFLGVAWECWRVE